MNKLKTPNILYGRDTEVKMLLESFEHISNGHGQVLLVSGSSGVGKTALVHELQMPVKDRNGFFITGKFEQYQQNIPYFAFRQALAELCLKLQSDDEQESSHFKAEILQSIGNLGQVLIEFVPEFESFLGPQPPLGDISPQEARHRFADVFRNFLKVICKPEHPLVLFIDDWQWADIASCELLKQIEVGVTLRYLQVIVAYRDNEVNTGHPLLLTLKYLKSHNVSIQTLKVKNITANDVQEFVTDRLSPVAENIEELTALIHNRTLGNPFFVKSFISFLQDLKLIWFDKERNQWKWDKSKTEDADLPANLIELFSQKLRRLDTKSRNLFSLAACLGNQFELEMLSIISGYSTQKCISLIFTDEAKTLLLPTESEKISSTSEDNHIYRKQTFLHDSAQQAAYMLIETEELPSILLKIGMLLLNRLKPLQLDERLFEVMNHLNAGSHLIQEEAEQIKIVKLNIQAASKANAATAYRSALQYYRAANTFLENPEFAEKMWRDHHKLTLDFFQNRAVCEFLEGDHSEAENCIQEAVDHSNTSLEKAQILNILIVQHTLMAKYPEAIESGKKALAALGINLPVNEYEKARDVEIALIRKELKSRPISSLIELPVMTNPEMLMAAKILITMGPPCYRAHQRLWSWIVPKVVNLTLLHGNIPQVGYSHTAYGGLLGWVDNDYDSAKEFSELATNLMTGTFQSPSEQSVFYLMIGSSIRHWFKHLSYGSQDYLDAYEIGLRSGNLQYAAYAFGHNMYSRFYQGVPLVSLIPESQHSLEFSQTRLNQWAIDLLEGGLKIFNKLSDENTALDIHIDLADKEYLQRVDNHQNIQVRCIYNVLKTFTLLLSGNYETALQMSDETEPIIYTVGSQGLLPWPEHVFSRMLILTSLYLKSEVELQTKWRSELGIMMKRLRIWADNSPENFEHKYLLVSAELARIDGQPLKAMRLYDKAIEEAQSGKFIQWEGIANERAFSFWIGCGNDSLADVYWKQAYISYDTWGATAKVKSMENEYRVRIANSLPGDNSISVPISKHEIEIKNDFLDKQIKLLRNYALQMQQTKLLMEAETHTSELSKATQRLRVEIAERKRTEKALRESEKSFHSLFDNMSEGVALHELEFLDGKPYDYRIINTNLQFCEILDITSEQVVGKLSTDAYHSKVPPYFKEYVDVATNKKTIFFETYFSEMDKHFAISVVPWQENGFATIFTDITMRKLAEEELKQRASELIELNSTKDKLFSIIAHDLRSPFNSILGFSELLSKNIKEFDIEEAKRFSGIINSAAHNSLILLDNLLNWAKSQTGKLSIKSENITLPKVIMEVIELKKILAQSKNISLNYNPSDKFEVDSDENMLKLVVRNLISNAIKFTKPGGNIDISVISVENHVEISVSDNGVGMSEDTCKKLFDISTNITSKGTANEKGSGLGLVLCKEFVEKLGGKIWVESEEGKGSTFYFTLPYISKPKELNKIKSEIPTHEDNKKIKKLKILVAEDDEVSKVLISHTLKQYSREILFALKGNEAVEISRKNPDIDLILMDIQMPDMNGYEATLQIRQFNKDVVIIAQTAFALAGDRDKAIEAGCNDYISKPIERQKLEHIIKKYFHQ